MNDRLVTRAFSAAYMYCSWANKRGVLPRTGGIYGKNDFKRFAAAWRRPSFPLHLKKRCFEKVFKPRKLT